MSDVGRKRAFVILAALALLAAGVLSYFAYSEPDALEHSLERHGPAHAVDAHAPPDEAGGGGYAAPLPDYAVPGLDDKPFLSGGLAGIIGVAATFAVIVVAGALLKRGGRGRNGKT